MALGCIFVCEGELVDKLTSAVLRTALETVEADLYILGERSTLAVVPKLAKALRVVNPDNNVRIYQSEILTNKVYLLVAVGENDDRKIVDDAIKQWQDKLRAELVAKLSNWETQEVPV